MKLEEVKARLRRAPQPEPEALDPSAAFKAAVAPFSIPDQVWFERPLAALSKDGVEALRSTGLRSLDEDVKEALQRAGHPATCSFVIQSDRDVFSATDVIRGHIRESGGRDREVATFLMKEGRMWDWKVVFAIPRYVPTMAHTSLTEPVSTAQVSSAVRSDLVHFMGWPHTTDVASFFDEVGKFVCKASAGERKLELSLRKRGPGDYSLSSGGSVASYGAQATLTDYDMARAR